MTDYERKITELENTNKDLYRIYFTETEIMVMVKDGWKNIYYFYNREDGTFTKKTEQTTWGH